MVNKGDGTGARQGGMDISVVILVYNEAAALPELYRELADTLDRLPQSAEIIFADDGRPTVRRPLSTPLRSAIRGFACSICRAITARPPP